MNSFTDRNTSKAMRGDGDTHSEQKENREFLLLF